MHSTCLLSLSFSLPPGALPTSAFLQSLVFSPSSHMLVISHLCKVFFHQWKCLFFLFLSGESLLVLGILAHVYFLHEAFLGFSWGESWLLHIAPRMPHIRLEGNYLSFILCSSQSHRNGAFFHLFYHYLGQGLEFTIYYINVFLQPLNKDMNYKWQ